MHQVFTMCTTQPDFGLSSACPGALKSLEKSELSEYCTILKALGKRQWMRRPRGANLAEFGGTSTFSYMAYMLHHNICVMQPQLFFSVRGTCSWVPYCERGVRSWTPMLTDDAMALASSSSFPTLWLFISESEDHFMVILPVREGGATPLRVPDLAHAHQVLLQMLVLRKSISPVSLVHPGMLLQCFFTLSKLTLL